VTENSQRGQSPCMRRITFDYFVSVFHEKARGTVFFSDYYPVVRFQLKLRRERESEGEREIERESESETFLRPYSCTSLMQFRFFVYMLCISLDEFTASPLCILEG